MNLREALVEEFPFVRRQRVHAYSEYAEVLPEGHWAALRQAVSSDADAQPGVHLIVALVDDEIAGSVALFPAKTDAYEGHLEALDYPEIRMLAVSPKHRGRGVATALVSECVSRAQNNGFSYIGLHTGEFMKGAMELYEKMGFERLPQYDFEPAGDGIIVKAYRLQLNR